jgi:hypothetical protein
MLNCVACGAFGTVAHHCINQQHKKRDHARTIPLCPECHVGPLSIHRSRKSFRARYGSEEDMLLKVNAMLEGER